MHTETLIKSMFILSNQFSWNIHAHASTINGSIMHPLMAENSCMGMGEVAGSYTLLPHTFHLQMTITMPLCINP